MFKRLKLMDSDSDQQDFERTSDEPYKVQERMC